LNLRNGELTEGETKEWWKIEPSEGKSIGRQMLRKVGCQSGGTLLRKNLRKKKH
jgi:hypothetical protein